MHSMWRTVRFGLRDGQDHQVISEWRDKPRMWEIIGWVVYSCKKWDKVGWEISFPIWLERKIKIFCNDNTTKA